MKQDGEEVGTTMGATVNRSRTMGWTLALLACSTPSLTGLSPAAAATRRDVVSTRALYPAAVASGAKTRQGPLSPAIALSYGILPREALLRTKAATVFIRVDAKGGELQGTGFFAIAPGLVLTNAHVVAPEDATGRDVRVVLNSGTPAERSLTGRVLAADEEADLALVRVSGKSLPEPLALAPAAGLMETMPLYVFGFPFGDGLAAKGRNPELSVLRASVSCLRHAASGRLDMIQLDGELHPGNSGGPVLDPFGRVVAITTSRLRSTRIGFAIPGERIRQITGVSSPGADPAPAQATPGPRVTRAQTAARCTRTSPTRRTAGRLW